MTDSQPFLDLAWLASVDPAAVVDTLEAKVAAPESPRKAFSQWDDDRFWITSVGRPGEGWRINVPSSWTTVHVEEFAVIANRFEDAAAIVRLGVDTDKTTYLAVVGQLVQVRDDVRLAA